MQEKYDDLLEKCNTISDIDDVLNNLCINDNLKVLVLKLKEDAFKDLNDYIKAIKFDELKVPSIPFYKAKSRHYYGIEEMKEGEK